MDIKEILKNKKFDSESGANNERATIVEDFLKRLNPSRLKAGYKPLEPARIGRDLSVYTTEELKILYKKCQKARNFSKMYWWHIRNPDDS